MSILSLGPTIACACYMKWGNPELAPLIGLAWDCGAVTTGPVTVPILLSLGIGVIKGQKARHAARELVEQQTEQNKGQALEGFGIITLASTFPILAVELMSIGISIKYTPEVSHMRRSHSSVLALCANTGKCHFKQKNTQHLSLKSTSEYHFHGTRCSP